MSGGGSRHDRATREVRRGVPPRPRGRARDRSRGGRPTKFTTRRVVAILAALWDGATRVEAARRAGLSPAAFYAWLQLGRAGHPTFAPLAQAVAQVEASRGLNGLFR